MFMLMYMQWYDISSKAYLNYNKLTQDIYYILLDQKHFDLPWTVFRSKRSNHVLKYSNK